jgi:CubicO group peptidase (beta-lactamase class C family)
MRGRGKKMSAILPAILAAILCLPAPGLSAESEEELYRAVDAFVAAELGVALVPAAALAIVRDGRVVHLAGFGEARPGVPAGPDTPFLIGSLSKSLTACAFMALVEEGRLSPGELATKAIPGFAPRDPEARSITMEELLTHRSGLGTMDGRAPLAYARDKGDAGFVAEASRLALAGPPDRAFRYSNWNYFLVGAAVEAASGEAYADYMKRRVFGPLGMKSTSARRAEAEALGLALGSRSFLGFPLRGPTPPYPDSMASAAYIASTARDMGLYLAALQRGGLAADGSRVLSEASVRAMTSAKPGSASYGYGWFIWHGRVFHDGDDADFHAHAQLGSPEEGRSGFVLLYAKNDYPSLALDKGSSFQYRVETGLYRILESGGGSARLRPSRAPSIRMMMVAGATLVLALLAVSALLLAGDLRRRAAGAPGSGSRASARPLALALLLHALLPAVILIGLPLFAESSWLVLLVFVPDFGWILGAFALLELAIGLARLGFALAARRAPRLATST